MRPSAALAGAMEWTLTDRCSLRSATAGRHDDHGCRGAATRRRRRDPGRAAGRVAGPVRQIRPEPRILLVTVAGVSGNFQQVVTMISYRTRRKFGLGDGHRSNDRTVSDTGGEVDGPKATGSFGVNTAVRLWVPVDRVEVFRWAMPPGLTGCGSPSGVVPSVNWMVPAAPWGGDVGDEVHRVTSEDYDCSLPKIPAYAAELNQPHRQRHRRHAPLRNPHPAHGARRGATARRDR